MPSEGGPQVADYWLVQEAVRAARAGIGGASRQEIRARLVGELRARGLVLPPPVVDYFTDDLLLRGDPPGWAHHEARRLTHLWQLGVFAVRALSAARGHRPLPHRDFTGMPSVRPDPQHMRDEIILDPGAQQLLSIDTHDPIGVWFARTESATGADPGESIQPTEDGGRVAVFFGDDRIGVLGPEASAAYAPVVQEASDAGVIVVALASRSQADDGSWRLHVPRPRAGW